MILKFSLLLKILIPRNLHLDHDPLILLNGSWEVKERNTTAAAFIGLLGIGAIYFNLQSILAIIFIAVAEAFVHVEVSGDFFESLKIFFNSFKIPILAALVITQYGAMLYPALWITRNWHTGDVKKYIRLNPVRFSELLLPAAITLFLQPAAYFLTSFIFDILSVPESFRTMGEDLFLAGSPIEFIILVFIIAVTPAICEEIFFRGYVQRTMERSLGRKSFIITGVLFGLFHMQPLGLLVLSLLGLLISYFYYRSKSLYPSMTSHFTNNFIALILLYSGEKVLNFISIPIIIILSSLASAVCFLLYLQITRDTGLREPIMQKPELPAPEAVNLAEG
jgi:membrane protease YdiL (CAAX protease family)